MSRILLVEDYASLQKVYGMALTAEGHEVETAGDGSEALKLTDKKQFDLIILDLLMPQIDGLSFLRSFEVSKHPHTQVLVMSNMSSPELLDEAKALGASQYLIKANTTPRDLATIAHNLLIGKKSPQA